LKNQFDDIRKITFFLLRCRPQYKNRKNFYSLCQFKKKFSIDAEWHFFATSHGKGPCDGIGGALKRNATKASLQRPYSNQITTAKDLYDWAKTKESAMAFHYCSEESYKKIENLLKNQFDCVKSIQGTQKFHSFVPIDESTVAARKISFQNNFEKFALK